MGWTNPNRFHSMFHPGSCAVEPQDGILRTPISRDLNYNSNSDLGKSNYLDFLKKPWGWFPEMYAFPSSSKILTTLGSPLPLKISGRSGKQAETASLPRADSTPLSPFTSEQTGRQEQDLDQPVSRTWGKSQIGGNSKSIASPQKHQCRSRWV